MQHAREAMLLDEERRNEKESLTSEARELIEELERLLTQPVEARLPGDVQRIGTILSLGVAEVHANLRFAYGSSALSCALSYDDINVLIVETLLQARADPNAVCDEMDRVVPLAACKLGGVDDCDSYTAADYDQDASALAKLEALSRKRELLVSYGARCVDDFCFAVQAEYDVRKHQHQHQRRRRRR